MLAFDLGIMLPAVGREDRVEMVRSMRDAPPEMMKMFSETSQRVLTAEEHQDLEAEGRASLVALPLPLSRQTDPSPLST